MARNFSDSPKEYKKLRCYSKNDNPFYIRHDTFITNSDIEVTENSSEISEQSFKIRESTEITKTRNAQDDKGNKLESESENAVADSFIFSKKDEKHIDKQGQQEQHDIEEIIWETKTITQTENHFRSEEKTKTYDSAIDFEEEELETIEKRFLFCKKDDVEGAIWDKEIKTNKEYKTDKSNTKLEVEDLKQIDQGFSIFQRDGNDSDKQEQKKQQDSEALMLKTRITTHRETQFKLEGQNETHNTLTKLKAADLEPIEASLLIDKKEKYKTERQDQSEKQPIEGKLLKAKKLTKKKNKFETKESSQKNLPFTEFEAEDLGQDINSVVLEKENTAHTENKFEPEKPNEIESVTKMEVKDVEQIEEIFNVGHKEEPCSDKQESIEPQDTEDIIWETEVTTNAVTFENGLEIEKDQENELNSKVFEFSSVLDKVHDTDEYKGILEEEEEYKSMSLLKIEGSKSKTLLREASDGDNQGIDKLVGETSFGCLLEIDRDKDENSQIDNSKSDLKGKFRLHGILDIEKMNEWEDESLSSDDEGFHELSLCINVGDEETKSKPVITNLLETICGDIGSLAQFDLSNIDEDQIKRNQVKSNENMIHNKESKFKFNCTVELETNNEEEQECEKNKTEADDNISPRKHIDEQDTLQKDHADTKENAKDTGENLTADEDIFDISDNEELLLFEQLFEQLSACLENEIVREEHTKDCNLSGGKGKEVSEEKFEAEIIPYIETQEDVILCIKETQSSLEGFKTASLSSSMVSLQLPFINANDNFEKIKYVPFTVDQEVHQDIKTAKNQDVLIIDKESNKKIQFKADNEENTENKDASTSDILTEAQSSSEWMLEVDKSDKAKTKTKAFIDEVAYKVAESQKRTEDIFTDVEALALWKIEADRRAEAKKKRDAFIEEIAYRITQSQMRIDQMFNEIENFAIWKLDIVRKEEANKKIEIEMSPTETQDSTIDRRKEDVEKETNRQIIESAANLQMNECNMKFKEKETALADQKTKAVEDEKNEEICFIFKEEAEKLQNQLFPGSNKQMKTHLLTETTEKCHENKEIFDQTGLEELEGGNDITLVKGKDDAEEIVIIQRSDTQKDNSRDGKYHPDNNDALEDISTKQDQLSEETLLEQQVTCLLPILSMLWFICLLLKLFQDETKLQQEQEKKSSDYKYFDILEWP